MTLTNLIVMGLATWRVSHMLINERGPFDVLTELRSQFGVRHDYEGRPISWPDNSLLECVWCLSVWVGLLFTLAPTKMSLPFAFSGATILLENWFGARDN